jgi:phage gpG-like protein
MVTTITVTSGEDLRELRSRAADSQVIGRIVARVLESLSQRSFLEQALGEEKWPERYPNMEDPFVNIAALVNWTNSGGTILPRFFDRRPALVGKGGGGGLMGSISADEKDGLVRVGSTLPYASMHQWGGTSSQPVTETAKKTVGRFLGFEKKDGEWKKKKKPGAKQKANFEKYAFRMLFLLGQDALETQVNQRPFLGITDEGEAEMVETIEAWVAHGEAG